MRPAPRSRSRVGEDRCGREEEVGRRHSPGHPSPAAETAPWEADHRRGILTRREILARGGRLDRHPFHSLPGGGGAVAAPSPVRVDWSELRVGLSFNR